MDYLTETPEGVAPADIIERALRITGMTEIEVGDTLGVARGKTPPLRLVRSRAGASAPRREWPDVYDAFSDHGFRSHPSTEEFPFVLNLCARTEAATAVVVTCCEGDVSITEHRSVADACAWMGAEAGTEASDWAFGL